MGQAISRWNLFTRRMLGAALSSPDWIGVSVQVRLDGITEISIWNCRPCRQHSWARLFCILLKKRQHFVGRRIARLSFFFLAANLNLPTPKLKCFQMNFVQDFVCWRSNVCPRLSEDRRMLLFHWAEWSRRCRTVKYFPVGFVCRRAPCRH